MSNGDLNWITNFIWGIADDALRDLYVRGKYRDVILPMIVLGRLDAVLEPTKCAVLSMKDNLDKADITNQDAALRQAAGQAFYNTSRFNLWDLRNRASQAQLKADFEADLDGFSPNVQEILDNFEFRLAAQLRQLPRPARCAHAQHLRIRYRSGAGASRLRRQVQRDPSRAEPARRAWADRRRGHGRCHALSKKAFEQAAASGAHLIAQVKANQPALHHALAALCDTTVPLDRARTVNKKRHSRDEVRSVEVFTSGDNLADTEWAGHVRAAIRGNRDALARSAATGLWRATSETACFVSDIALPATICAKAIRNHWNVENHSHYVRDTSFAEDASRIRCNPGIVARLRSFATNILRCNDVHNVTDARHRIAFGGIDAILSIRVMN